MNFKETLVKAGKRMLQSGLTVETWGGNISVRDPETRRVYLTPSGMDYNICTEKDIVVCDLDGNILDGNRKPTIEKKLHLQIYLNRPEINVVIHTHPSIQRCLPVQKRIFRCLLTKRPRHWAMSSGWPIMHCRVLRNWLITASGL